VFFNGGDQSRHARAWFKDDGTDSDIMRVLRDRFIEGLVIAGTSAGAAIQSNPTYGEGYSYGYYYFNADLKTCRIGEQLVDDRDGTNSFRYDENGGYMKGFGFVQDVLVDTQ
jgi:cyanophycinase-like exopeptidase